jgi:hypothetical protein
MASVWSAWCSPTSIEAGKERSSPGWDLVSDFPKPDALVDDWDDGEVRGLELVNIWLVGDRERRSSKQARGIRSDRFSEVEDPEERKGRRRSKAGNHQIEGDDWEI